MSRTTMLAAGALAAAGLLMSTGAQAAPATPEPTPQAEAAGITMYFTGTRHFAH